MTEKQMFDLLSTLKIPVAYDHFEEYPQNKISPPFVVYRNTDPTTAKAEDVTWYVGKNYMIDLVTDLKNPTLEETLETLLTNNSMPFDKEENYIDEERIYQVRYYTN